MLLNNVFGLEKNDKMPLRALAIMSHFLGVADIFHFLVETKLFLVDPFFSSTVLSQFMN